MAFGWILVAVRLSATVLSSAVFVASHESYIELGQSKSGDAEIVKAIDYDTELAKQQRKKIGILPEKVCYGAVGCFSRQDRITHPVALPEDPKDVGTQFYLYSRENRDIPTVITEPGPTSLVSHAHFFRQPKKLAVLLHGFTQSAASLWLHHTKAALLKQVWFEVLKCNRNAQEDVNVMLVDWANGCRSPNYFSAVGNSALIGRQVSFKLQSLVRQFPETVDPARIHVIGFSLGGQASGFCGRHFLNWTGRHLGRITVHRYSGHTEYNLTQGFPGYTVDFSTVYWGTDGCPEALHRSLDPAGPLFEDSDVRVSQADAHFVDIIHTSYGWNLLKGDLGMQAATGHVDFYPNFQERQPGCDALSLSCRHRRAHMYFVESVESDSCKFVSSPCLPDTADPQCDGLPRGVMGYGSEHAPGRGEQFLKTNYEPPFCLPTELDDTT